MIVQFESSLSYLNSGPHTGGIAMRRDELMGPDLLSEIVIVLGGAIVVLFLTLTVLAALAAK
jgi:hypothetical protein